MWPSAEAKEHEGYGARRAQRGRRISMTAALAAVGGKSTAVSNVI